MLHICSYCFVDYSKSFWYLPDQAPFSHFPCHEQKLSRDFNNSNIRHHSNSLTNCVFQWFFKSQPFCKLKLLSTKPIKIVCTHVNKRTASLQPDLDYATTWTKQKVSNLVLYKQARHTMILLWALRASLQRYWRLSPVRAQRANTEVFGHVECVCNTAAL